MHEQLYMNCNQKISDVLSTNLRSGVLFSGERESVAARESAVGKGDRRLSRCTSALDRRLVVDPPNVTRFLSTGFPLRLFSFSVFIIINNTTTRIHTE